MSGISRTRVHLVRHGAVHEAWRGRLYGDLDVPLSPLGERQARVAATRLCGTTGHPAGASHDALDLVLHSGLARAQFGARCIAEACDEPPQLECDERFRELRRGSWAGLRPEELEAREPGALEAWRSAPDRLRPEGGESLDDLAARVLPALDEWAARTPEGELALVAHGWVIRVVLLEALGLPRARAARLRIPPGSISTVDWPCGERDSIGAVLVGLDGDRPRIRSRGWYGPPRGASRGGTS